MKKHLFFKIFTTIIILLLLSYTRQDNYSTILIADKATRQELLAAKEVRRYVYQRTGKVLSIIRSDTLILTGTDLIILAKKDRPIVEQLNNENLNKDIIKLADQEFRCQMAQKIFEGIVDYVAYMLDYIPPESEINSQPVTLEAVSEQMIK